MKKAKKGEYNLAGKQIGVLVLAIALFIALFVLFLPPEDREFLLDQNRTTTSSGREVIELLSETPGLISPLKEFATKHEVPDINLFVKTEPLSLNLANKLEVTKSLLGGSSPLVLSFDVQDLSNINKASLFFAVEEAKGKLSVKLNGKDVETIEGEKGIAIVELPSSYLEGEDNRLELKVSNPGVLLWRKNSFLLSDVNVKLEFKRINAQETRDLVITQSEKDSLEIVKLKYFLVCNSREQLTKGTTPFVIYLNDERVFSTQTSCISTSRQHDINPSDIRAGNNELIFSIEEGDFSFNQIVLETKGDERTRPSFTFFLSEEDYERIKSGKDDIKLRLLLEDNKRTKTANILVNRDEFLMKTESNTYSKSIRSSVERGTNIVRLSPSTEFNVLGLKVFIER